MRIAILADIHGNLDALTRVLEQVYALGADRIVCLGDIVGYGAYPNECLSLVRANCTTVVRGNHEAGVAGLLPPEHFEQYGRAALAWTRDRLTDEHLAYVRELPLSVSENEITLVHASPKDPGEWNYMLDLASGPGTVRVFHHHRLLHRSYAYPRHYRSGWERE